MKTFSEIKDKILVKYPTAKITERKYDFDYFSAIHVCLQDYWYFFTKRVDPVLYTPLGGEEGEKSIAFQGFTPDQYPDDLVDLILITLANNIVVQQRYVGKAEEVIS